MAYQGQVIDNPISGERITFVKTAADTNGELLAVDLELSRDGQVPGAHVHPFQEERFEIVDGTMRFRKGLKAITARAGDRVVVPPGMVHRFENAGNTTAHVRVEVRPALRMEELFEVTVALAREGHTNKRGMPHPLALAVFMQEFEAEVRAPFVPTPAVRAATAPLRWLAWRRGLDLSDRQPAFERPQPRRDSRRPATRAPYGGPGGS
jgi:quercetin dioxygenase-like cupin family protein